MSEISAAVHVEGVVEVWPAGAVVSMVYRGGRLVVLDEDGVGISEFGLWEWRQAVRLMMMETEKREDGGCQH